MFPMYASHFVIAGFSVLVSVPASSVVSSVSVPPENSSGSAPRRYFCGLVKNSEAISDRSAVRTALSVMLMTARVTRERPNGLSSVGR